MPSLAEDQDHAGRLTLPVHPRKSNRFKSLMLARTLWEAALKLQYANLESLISEM